MKGMRYLILIVSVLLMSCGQAPTAGQVSASTDSITNCFGVTCGVIPDPMPSAIPEPSPSPQCIFDQLGYIIRPDSTIYSCGSADGQTWHNFLIGQSTTQVDAYPYLVTQNRDCSITLWTQGQQVYTLSAMSVSNSYMTGISVAKWTKGVQGPAIALVCSH